MTTMKKRQHEIKYGKILGENLRRYREAAHLSKFRFAAESGLDMHQVIALEAGCANPVLETLQRISDTLNVPLSALFQEPPTQLTSFPLALYQPSFDNLDLAMQGQALAILRLLCNPNLISDE